MATQAPSAAPAARGYPAAMDAATFNKWLRIAYEGELWASAYYAELLRRAPTLLDIPEGGLPGVLDKIRLLLRLEVAVGKVLAPVAAHHGIAARPAEQLRAKGVGLARKVVSWKEEVDGLLDLEGIADTYGLMESYAARHYKDPGAPPDYARRMALLHSHERAFVAMYHLEVQGKDGTGPAREALREAEAIVGPVEADVAALLSAVESKM